jgi:hypothetical protein
VVSTSSELPTEAFAALADAPAGITGVVATVDADGRAHTAPFGSLWAASPQRLRFGCDRRHTTFENLAREPRVAVCVIAPPDVAISVFGRASVIRATMELLATDAVVEVRIEEVKDDLLAGSTIESGVTYSVPDAARDLVERYLAEVRRAEA